MKTKIVIVALLLVLVIMFSIQNAKEVEIMLFSFE
ncbi:MAG: putative integral membrane protein, partial [Arenicella sp.]